MKVLRRAKRQSRLLCKQSATLRPADVNDDNDITIADVTALVNIILGKE